MASGAPNVIFILADDCAYGDLGAFGNAQVRTPALDRLASSGVRLTQHYSGSCVCAPARACLLTGRYPHRTGATDLLGTYGRERLALGERTLADALAARGYATGLVGKWHLGAFDPRCHPNRRGFREFVGFHFALMDYYDWTLDRNGAPVPADGRYLTEVFTAEAIQFVRRHRHEPFFLYLAYNAPHGPLQAPETEISPFLEAGLPKRTATIYAMNSVMDRGIGQLLEELERLGLAEHTIVVFASDNGPAPVHAAAGDVAGRFNARLRGHKYLTYEGGIRVPGIVRWPAGLPAGATVGELVHFADWFPTLCQAAGVTEPPANPLDGVSALPALRGKVGADSGAAGIRHWQWNRYTPIPRYNAAVRDGAWKLVFPAHAEVDGIDPQEGVWRRRVERGEMAYEEVLTLRPPEPDRRVLAASLAEAPQLFNVAEDPHEAADLADTHPDIVSRLTRLHDAWWDEVHEQSAPSAVR
jgi:arylsulfatase A